MPTTEDIKPAFDWQQYSGETGFENVTQGDLGMPFLAILQKGSAEVDVTHAKHMEKKIEGASAGDIINTASREVLFKFRGQGLRVVPTFRIRIWQEWKPQQAGGGLVRTHADSSVIARCRQDEQRKFIISEGEGLGNQVKETVSWFCMAEIGGEWQQVVVNMSGANLGSARQWLTKATTIKWTAASGQKFSPPLFSHVYLLKTEIKQKANNSWFSFSVDIEGTVKDKELAQKAISWHVDCSQRNQRLLAPIAEAAANSSQEGDEHAPY